VEQRVEALRAETLWQPSDKNDETRQYFVNACQGKQRAK